MTLFDFWGGSGSACSDSLGREHHFGSFGQLLACIGNWTRAVECDVHKESREGSRETRADETNVRKPLRFENLAARHAIDPHQLQGYANAAKVQLEKHHQPPTQFEVTSKGETYDYSVEWVPVDDLLRRSYNNADDATRDGAYVMAFAAVEDIEGMVGIARADTKTGADYYVAPVGSSPDDLEMAFRLEVSGTNGPESVVRQRLKEKQQQTRDGIGTEPAIAAVVGFKAKLILLERA